MTEIIKIQGKIKELNNKIELNPRAISWGKKINQYF